MNQQLLCQLCLGGERAQTKHPVPAASTLDAAGTVRQEVSSNSGGIAEAFNWPSEEFAITAGNRSVSAPVH